MLKPMNFRKCKTTAVILIIKSGNNITAKTENPQIQSMFHACTVSGT